MMISEPRGHDGDEKVIRLQLLKVLVSTSYVNQSLQGHMHPYA